MSNSYKLDENKNAIPCDIMEWANQLKELLKSDKKHVSKETIGDLWISTVWLGLDHQYGGGPPLLYETMIKNEKTGEWLNYQNRYSTWKEAEEGHKRAVEWVNNGCKEEQE